MSAIVRTAIEALQGARYADALPPLLVLWRTRPIEPLAEAIAEASRRARVPLPRTRGKSAAAIAAWNQRAATAAPHEIPALLDGIADVPSTIATARLERLAAWLPDPRVDEAIVTLLEAVPYRATSTKPFWAALFVLAEGITDPRQLPRLDRADATGVATSMATWLRARLAKLREHLAPRLRAAGAAPAWSPIEQIGSLLAPLELSRRSENLAALLQAIHDAPDDDAPRAVYADALLERGDPRGELIAIQLQRDAAPELRRREHELLAAHAVQWLGGLAPVISPGFRFERGFLVECQVSLRDVARVRRLVGDPAWSTVRTLGGSAAVALDPVARSLRALHFSSFQARTIEDLPHAWRELLVATPRSITRLHYTGLASDRAWEAALEANESVRPGMPGRVTASPDGQELAALCTCPALAQLRELTLAEHPELVAAPLLRAPVTGRLAVLGFVFDPLTERRPLQWFDAYFQAAPVPTLRFEIGATHLATHVELTRGARGYHGARLEVGPTIRGSWSKALVDEAIALLDALPPSIRELRIAVRRFTDPAQVTRLRAAATQLNKDLCEVG
jgi:uncharacterized protein (TIGR02996 family)